MSDSIKVVSVKPLDWGMLLLTFSDGFEGLFDTTEKLNASVFYKIREPDIWNNPRIAHGTVTWNDEQIDCSPDYLYQNCHHYDRIEE